MSVRPRDGIAAFDRLFAAEYARVVRIAQRVLGEASEAEDVAQEVFCAFYRTQAPDAPHAPAWLHRAAAHTALNVVRGKQRRIHRERVADAVERPIAHGPDPQDVVVDAERRQEVREALRRLPEKSASALALRYSGLSYAEVADALGVRTGNVGTILRRAEAALLKEMNYATH
jgi:RNA polymerase sigma-70 factor (ECF subfamily)